MQHCILFLFVVEKGSGMLMIKKVITCAIMSAMIFLNLFSWLGGGNYRLSINEVGPNGSQDRYFFRTVSDEKGHPQTGISRIDLDSGEDVKIFEVENGASDRIKNVKVEGDTVSFVVDRAKSDPEYQEYFIDGSGKCELVSESDDEKDFDADAEIHSIYEDTTSYDYTLEDGSVASFSKTFGDENFYCTVGERTYILEAISQSQNKNADYSYMSDKNGVIYGFITVPETKLNEDKMKVSPSLLHESDIKKEILFSFDTSTGDSKVLYEGSKGRIVGFSDEAVYLLKGRAVSRITISSGKSKKIGKIVSYKDDVIMVKWIGSKVVFYGKDGTVLGIING